MVNDEVGSDCSTIIFPYHAVERTIGRNIVPVFYFAIDDTVEFLVSVIDNFDGGRCGQVAFEYVNSVAFKVVIGKLAQFGE